MPKGPCDTTASETLDFLGRLPASSPRLPELNTMALLSAQFDPAIFGDKLEAGNDDITPMTWDLLKEPEDVWFWIEHGFIPDVWLPRSQQIGNATLQGLVAQKNLIIGGMRARQKRAMWSPTCEEKANPELNTFYSTDCRSSEASTSSYGPYATGEADYNASGMAAATTTASASASSTSEPPVTTSE